jgi:hypothetical protein
MAEYAVSIDDLSRSLKRMGRLVSGALAAAACLSLAACGGNDPQPAANATNAANESTVSVQSAIAATPADDADMSAPDVSDSALIGEDTGQGEAQASSQGAKAPPAWDSAFTPIYDLEEPTFGKGYYSFDEAQFAINQAGDVFIAWSAPSVDANGQTVGTDILVSRTAAGAGVQAARKIGFVPAGTSCLAGRSIRVVLERGRNAAVFWDISCESSRSRAFYQPYLTGPSKVYYNRYDARRDTWSETRVVPGTDCQPYVVLGAWSAAPGGKGKIAFFWQAQGSAPVSVFTQGNALLSSFLSLRDGTWTPPQDIYLSAGLPPLRYLYGFSALPFSHEGVGLLRVTDADRNPEGAPYEFSFYYDPRANKWTEIALPANAPIQINKQGDVIKAEIVRSAMTGDRSQLQLTKFNAATRQLEPTAVLFDDPGGALLSNLGLWKNRQGYLLTWLQIRRDESHIPAQQRRNLGTLQLSATGKVLGAPTQAALEVGIQVLDQQITRNSTLVLIYQNALGELFSNAYCPLKCWAQGQQLALADRVNQFNFKANRAGEGVLIQTARTGLDFGGGGAFGQEYRAYRKEVFATRLRHAR